MKEQPEKSRKDHTLREKPRFPTRALSAMAPLRGAFLALVCAAAADTCLAAVNRPPTAQNLSIVAPAGFSTPVVLKGSDQDADPLTFTVVTFPSHGTLGGLVPNLTYTSASNYVGPDSFTYVARDNRKGVSSPATVSITVKHGISINNVSILEGNSGTKSATFTVTISGPAPVEPITCSFQTIDGTAKAGLDYLPTSGTIPPSFSTARPVTVSVIGDQTVEFDETFLVQLSNPVGNAVIASGTGRGTIINDDGSRHQIGTAALAPEHSVVAVGELVNLSLGWTHPVGWRRLNSVDLLLVDDEGAILPLRWNEAPNSFSLFSPAAGRFVRTAGAGHPARFETPAATLYLQESTGGGPPGQTVDIQYTLSFKPQAAGRTFSVEAFATDDTGQEQGFESVGTITVLPR